MSGPTCAEIDEGLLRHACSEFLEMPGLRLTGKQAQRLWGLDERTCLALLEFLVDAHFLRRTSAGMYARASDGPAEPPHLRRALSDIDDSDPRRVTSPAAAAGGVRPRD